MPLRCIGGVLALAMCCACPFRYNMLSPQADLGRYFTHGTTSVMRRCRPGQRRMFCSWVWGGAHFSFLPSLPFSCTHQPPILDSLLARRPSERLWLRRAPTVIFRSSCPLTRGLHSYSVRLAVARASFFSFIQRATAFHSSLQYVFFLQCLFWCWYRMHW